MLQFHEKKWRSQSQIIFLDLSGKLDHREDPALQIWRHIVRRRITSEITLPGEEHML